MRPEGVLKLFAGFERWLDGLSPTVGPQLPVVFWMADGDRALLADETARIGGVALIYGGGPH